MLKSIKVVSICHFWGKMIKLADFWKIVSFNFTLNLGLHASLLSCPSVKFSTNISEPATRGTCNNCQTFRPRLFLNLLL